MLEYFMFEFFRNFVVTAKQGIVVRSPRGEEATSMTFCAPCVPLTCGTEANEDDYKSLPPRQCRSRPIDVLRGAPC